MPHEFVPLAERIIDELLASDPGFASYAGDHRHDDRLVDLSVSGVAATVAMLRDAADRLAEVDGAGLAPAEQVDLAILQSMVDRRLFALTELREHEWNPLTYNPGAALYGLISREFAPAAERLSALAGRLAAVPDLLASARANLVDCPTVHVETAITQFAGVASLIRDEIPALVRSVPAMAGTVDPLIDPAGRALDDFGKWLRDKLSGPPGRSPRLGRPAWEAKLWHTLDTDLSARQVLDRAQARLDEVAAEIRGVAAELGESATDDGVRAALDRLADEHPDNDTIVGLATAAMAEAADYIRAHDLVTVPDDPCQVREMPPYARGVAVAYCEAPGPLETAEVPTFYCIAPTPAGWSPERVTSFYREYNIYLLRDITVHEAQPGHFLQQAHGRKVRGSTRTRAVGYSGTFIEGWAVYAEQMMVTAGFGGPQVRLQQLKMQLRMIINALLDQLVHCDDFPESDAMALMTGRGFQEEGEAAGKWRRALLTSTQLSTYFVGYTEMAAIAAQRPADHSPRQWHDAMLSHGSPAPRHLRTLLGC
jgi:uncharacterized protein (DUF885 family)